MTINSTTRKTNNLVGNGNTNTYPFAFKVFADSEILVKKLEVSTSIETTLTLGASNDYIVTLNSDQNGNPGGSITLKSGGNNFNLPNGFQIVITSAVQSLQGTDLTNQGGFYPEVINDALDKAAILHQQQQDELDRSIKFSLTNTIGSLEITENANARKNKVLSFDNAGEFSVLQELGTYRGDWAASTAYVARDLVKDTTTNNIFMCNTAHTSSGSEPLTTNTNAANWDLIVDALAATTSANNAATSATQSANSATASANSASAAATSETNAATSETNANTHKNDAQTAKTAAETAQTAAETAKTAAETALDTFDDRYLGAKNSDPATDNDGNNLLDGALYFNTTDNVTKVYDLGNTAWVLLKLTPANQANVNTVQGSISNVNSVAGNISNVNAVANNETNINSAVSNASNINSAVSNASNINTVAGAESAINTVSGSISNVNTVGGGIANVNTVAAEISNNKLQTVANNINAVVTAANDLNETTSEIDTVANAITNVDNVGNSIANVNTVAGSVTNVNTTAGSITNVNTVASNISSVNVAATNVADINNFSDIYIISSSQPTNRSDGTNLQEGDLWYDSSNDNLLVYTGSAFSIITPSQSVLDDVAIVSGAITYSEDLGLITNAVSTGSSNGSLDIVADVLEDEITFTVTAATGKFIIDGVDKPALTLYKGWTYTFDVSDASNSTHQLRFSSGGSAYNTGVTVTGTQGQAGAKVQLVVPETQPTTFAYYCTQHSGMGNTITVKDDPIKTVSDNISSILTAANNNTNVSAVSANATNINTVAGKATEIGRLGTADAVADMNTLGTSAIVTDMDTLADISSNITTVANNDTNVTAVANNSTNINAAVSNASNINTVSGISANVTTVASNNTNVTTVAGSITNVNNVGGSIANVNSVANNISSVNSFANLYRIDSSDPGSNNDEGDLYFNTTSNELRVYNGSTWQGGVTATGNLAGLGANTYTGNQTINANILVSGTVDGVDIATRDTLFGGLTSVSGALTNGVTASTQSASDNTTKVATTAYVTTAISNVNTNLVADTTPQLGGDLDGQNNDLTNIGTISGANLQLDFGTI